MEIIVHIIWGVLVCAGLVGLFIGAAMNTNGAEFVNPFYLKKRFRVNWFGAFMLALVFNVVAIPWAICYWIYKICTVGS